MIWRRRGPFRGVFVAGAGRSGTSVATRLAATSGLRLPPPDDLLPADPGNPSGYWESRSLMELNDRLLAVWARTWWLPPAELAEDDLSRLEPMGHEAEAACRRVFPDDGWLWKDPRLTVLLPFWESVLGIQPILFPYREPQAVAHSVAKRDGLTFEQALGVWERHTRCALRAIGGRPVVIAAYRDLLDDPDRWRDDFHRFCRRMRVPGLAAEPAERDASSLVTGPRSPAEGDLSPEQAHLWSLLEGHRGAFDRLPSLALGRETPGLDAILAPAALPVRVRPCSAAGGPTT